MQATNNWGELAFWEMVSQIGTKHLTNDNIKKKVVLSNQLSFLMLVGVTASTFIFSYTNGGQEMSLLIASLCLVPCVTLLLNQYAYTDISRFFFGITTPLLVLYIIVMLKVMGSYYGYQFKVSEYHFYTPRYYLVALSLLPLFLIDLRERKMFAASMLINVGCLMLFDFAHDAFGVGYQHFGFQFQNYYQASIMPVILLFFMYGSIAFYQFESKKYEDKIIRLKDQLQLHNDQIVAEIDLAKKVVEGLLPKAMPKISGLDIAAYLTWSKEVGGDYYTVRTIDTTRTLFMVADVSGKGLSASIVVSTLHSYIETQLNAGNFQLESFVAKMNEVICKVTEESRYITCWVGVYNSIDNSLQSVNAGHPKPIIYNTLDKSFTELSVGGTILGFFDEGYRFKTETYQFKHGDTLLVYTDGVSEAANSHGKQYEDDEHIYKLLATKASLSSNSIILSLTKDIIMHTMADHFEDDLTCMVVKKM